jgi:hypothetical protein
MFNTIKTFTTLIVELYIISLGNRSCYLEKKLLEIVYGMRIELQYMAYYI